MAKSKYNRSEFYEQNIIDGVLENDLVTNYFKDFGEDYEYTFYTLRRTDIRRFDILSLRFYNSIKYWWILAKINKIDDLWNDPYVGQTIKIPNINDIESFYIKNKR